MASFNRAFLTILLLCVISISTTKGDLIQNECVRVHQKYETTDVNRCVKMLSAAKATNLIDLTMAALALGERTAQQINRRINDTLASGKLSRELQPIVSEIRDQLVSVELGFYWAHGVVQTRGDFNDADYSLATMTDNFRIAGICINKAKGKIDPSYQSGIDELRVLRNIGLVLIEDADPHTELEE